MLKNEPLFITTGRRRENRFQHTPFNCELLPLCDCVSARSPVCVRMHYTHLRQTHAQRGWMGILMCLRRGALTCAHICAYTRECKTRSLADACNGTTWRRFISEPYVHTAGVAPALKWRARAGCGHIAHRHTQTFTVTRVVCGKRLIIRTGMGCGIGTIY